MKAPVADSVTQRVFALARMGRSPSEIRSALQGETYAAISQGISRARGQALFSVKRPPLSPNAGMLAGLL